MGQFTVTTLGVLVALCVLALAATVARRTRGAGRTGDAVERRALLRDALRSTRRSALLATCEAARRDEDVREDVLVVARGLALAPQRALLVVSVEAAGLDDDLRRSLCVADPACRARAASLLGLLRLAESSELEPLLADPDDDVRLVAARAIAMLDSAEGARALIAALATAPIDTARLVEQLARPSAVPELVRALADPSLAAVRPALSDALGSTRSVVAISPLSSIVRGGIGTERTAACRALGRIARPEVVPLLVEALADDAWEVRAEAARGLTGIGDGSCVPELERSLADRAWWVRANAARALRSIAPEGVAALVRASGSADPATASHAREALALEPPGEGIGLAA